MEGGSVEEKGQEQVKGSKNDQDVMCTYTMMDTLILFCKHKPVYFKNVE